MRNGPLQNVKLYTDGCCKGNPGPGSIGVLIMDDVGTELRRLSECIGTTTNNRAEYRALIKGLDLCAEFTRGVVTCYSDSMLLVNQMGGTWRIANPQLRKLWHEAQDYERVFRQVVYQFVPRSNQFIRIVDRLANDAMDGK